MTCKDCVHYDVCKIWCGEANIRMSTDCDFVKNKADFVEVKHGEWVFNRHPAPNEKSYFCSLCAEGGSDYGEDNYCSYCGADMRKEGADNG